MRKLSQAEKVVYGDCEICGAKHGKPCREVDTAGSMARMQDGAHLGRLYHAPDEVPESEDAPAKKPVKKPAKKKAVK